ncbi:MAG: DUF4367 domain-containing protein [Eubacterium sp.]
MNSEEMIREALKEVFDERYPYRPDAESELEWEFTEEYQFEDKMNKLIHSQKKSYWKYVNTAGKRIAVIIVFLVVMFSSAMTVNAFRKPVVDFIIETYEKFSAYFADKSTLKYSDYDMYETIEKIYIPTEIPDGFTESENNSDNYTAYTIWCNDAGMKIKLYQMSVILQSNLNTENTDIIQTEINGLPLYTYKQDNTISYLWYDYGYTFTLILPDNFTADDAGRIIESIEAQE